MKKKIFVLLGHPDKISASGDFAGAYVKGAESSGHEVKRLNIGDLKFDPILHQGYKVIQELEPDLLTVQEYVKWCDHFVIFYPSWWSTMPALLKGMFDRMWLPGFAYHFNKGGTGWHRMLKGKTARVFVTSDSMPLIARIIFGDTTNEIRKGILWFAGFSVTVKKIGPMKNLTVEKKEKFSKMVESYGKKAL